MRRTKNRNPVVAMAPIKAGADPTARDEDGNLPIAARSRDRKPSVRK